MLWARLMILIPLMTLLYEGVDWDETFWMTRRASRPLLQGARLLAQNDTQSALKAFDKAVVDPSADMETSSVIAEMLLARGMEKEGLKYIRRANWLVATGQARAHGRLDIWYYSEMNRMLADHYYQKGDFSIARDTYWASIMAAMDNYQAWNNLGYMYLEHDYQVDKAFKFIKTAAEGHSNDGSVVDSLGWVYYKKGNYQKAFKHLRKAAQLEPGSSEIRYHLGMALEKIGNPKAARIEYMKALALNPSYKEPADRLKALRRR